jgi:hypothetical protein
LLSAGVAYSGAVMKLRAALAGSIVNLAASAVNGGVKMGSMKAA